MKMQTVRSLMLLSIAILMSFATFASAQQMETDNMQNAMNKTQMGNGEQCKHS